MFSPRKADKKFAHVICSSSCDKIDKICLHRRRASVNSKSWQKYLEATSDTVSKLQKGVFCVKILTPKRFWTDLAQLWLQVNFLNVKLFIGFENSLSRQIKNRINSSIDRRWMITGADWNYLEFYWKMERLLPELKLSGSEQKALAWTFHGVLWCYFSQVLEGDKKLKFHKQFHIVWESGAASKNFSMNWSALTSFSSPWAFSTEKLNYAARPTTFVLWTWKIGPSNEPSAQQWS